MKSTNKYIQLIALWAIILIGMTGCDTKLDVDEEITGYSTFSTSFIQQELKDQYTIIFDGKEIKDKLFLDRGVGKGKLEVFKKGTSKAVYSQEISLTGSETIQFIVLNGKVDLYSEDKYTTFNTLFVPLNTDEAKQYSLRQNGYEVSLTNPTYIPTTALKGKLEIFKDGKLVGTEENVEVKPEGTLTVLEVTDMNTGGIKYTALRGGSANEPSPSNQNRTKINFFYNKADLLADADSIYVEFFTFDQSAYTWGGGGDDVREKHSSVVVKAGELSPYIEFDLSKYKAGGMTTGFFYTIHNAAPSGEMLFNSVNYIPITLFPKGWEGDALFLSENKFQTNFFAAEGGVVSCYEVSTQKWETEEPAQ